MRAESDAEVVRSEFIRQFGSRAGNWPRLYQAPGRINIIGEHTDYNDGFVLPCTIDLHTWVAARPRDDRLLNVYDCGEKQQHSLHLDKLRPGEKGQPVEYIKAVPWALLQEGLDLRGCDMAVGGNIPLGGGLSSSASLELVLAFALLDCSGLQMERGKLALACQRAEAEFVGARCGIMDQYAIALGAKKRAMLLDCRSLDYGLVKIPSELRFLIVHSGVNHRVSTGSYNSRRDECEEALNRLRATIPGLASLRELTAEQLEENQDQLGDLFYRRCRHVVTENQRVLDAVETLKHSELERLGSLVTRSHNSLRDDYEVSCEKLDRLVDIATRCDGVLGARMMGAGFGGCTVNVVAREAVDDAIKEISNAYARIIGRNPWVHVAGQAGAVKKIG